jgi:hypothetical protein
MVKYQSFNLPIEAHSPHPARQKTVSRVAKVALYVGPRVTPDARYQVPYTQAGDTGAQSAPLPWFTKRGWLTQLTTILQAVSLARTVLTD